MTTSTDWATTARLLRRTGFGATGSEVDAAVRSGAGRWLDAALAADPSTDPGTRSTPAPTPAAVPAGGKDQTREQRQRRNEVVRTNRAAATGWWLRRMAATGQPLVEKVTFGWHNHFATDIHKVRDARLVLAQNATLRRLGRASFTELARALVVDPAMLVWLDGQKSTATAPNENLSREFMELFTLGHGSGYTEQDVREGARALTGWKVTADATATLVASRHDSRSKTVLGRTGDLDAIGFVDAVLAQPASARFVATRWWQLLVSPTPPTAEQLVRVTAAYGSGRDLSAMFRAMLTDPAMAASTGSLVVSPVEWAIGAVRALQVPMTDDKQVKALVSTLNGLGQVPFAPPNVSGWPSGQAWLSTAAAQTRLRAATRLAGAGDLDAIRSTAPGTRIEAVAHLLAIPSLSDRSVVALRTVSSDPMKLVAAALVSPEYLVN
ncbi:DUF1800 domain-containing protein [Dermatophilaceae bacterium Soc4.6]